MEKEAWKKEYIASIMRKTNISEEDASSIADSAIEDGSYDENPYQPEEAVDIELSYWGD